MSLGLLGKKIGMTRVFNEEGGVMIPVTVVDVAGNVILQRKTEEVDGYNAVQVGYGDQKAQRVNQPALGHFKKHGSEPKRFIREFHIESGEEAPAEHPGVGLFEVGAYVDVIATTKGKGFQGAVKRHGFGGLKDSHGSMMHRRTGAIAAGSSPGRVWKNQKMPGHDGHVSRTTQSLEIVQVRPDDGVILISGAVPGPNGGYVVVSPAIKKKAAVAAAG